MKRIVIKVRAEDADMLQIGEDCNGLGQKDYVVEKIGEPFRNDKGCRMVEITIVERTQS